MDARASYKNPALELESPHGLPPSQVYSVPLFKKGGEVTQLDKTGFLNLPSENSIDKYFSPLRDTRILFCGCGLKYFSPLRDTKILFCGCTLKYSSPLRDTKILLYGRGLKYFSPLRDTKILLYGRGLKYFSPLRGTNSKQQSSVTAFLFENSYCGTF